MKSRKALLALAVAATALGGCATYPYDDPYQNGYYQRDYYGNTYYNAPPAYYTGPSVGFGITYTDRNDYWRHRHYR